ncbi:GIY-YIG nuclease family protein [Flammeovirga sp. EKP202]|uniref:GIY-YIG nuclease family protein n=1 Tax=Flammeovirga sp. EKP202 TaxID=2770592 RepID=UPI00165F0EBE|nr:GIY-YIG nuclease family protein [Flammeovirga sp. EKP202]MBD0400571.1 GIY-YIG nuclease family protein [Flammeovirga sp. EKP202]
MMNEFIYIASAFLALFCLTLILLFLSIKRGKKIKSQTTLLNKRDDSEERYKALEETLEQTQKEAKERYFTLEERLKKVESERDHKGKNLIQTAERLLKDHTDFLATQVTASNYVETKNKLEEVFDFCLAHDYENKEALKQAQKSLQRKFEDLVRKDLEQQSQNELKDQMREERTFQEKVKGELERLEQEKIALQRDLHNAIHAANEKQVQQLQFKLDRVEEHIQRATEQSSTSTTSGFVYVLSNYGSFGEEVFKIGYTQSDDPQSEINALSETLPFPFDVHALINASNAEHLYQTLKEKLQKYSVNKVNLEKDFFAVPLEKIVEIGEELEGKFTYEKEPEALEYFQSMETSVEDLEYLLQVKRQQQDTES